MDAKLIWLTLLLPVAGAVVQTLLRSMSGTDGGKRLLGFLAVLPIAAAFLIGAMITKSMDPGQATTITQMSWIELKGLSIPFELRIDSLSMTMVLIITGIGALIHLYATGYMAKEKDYSRFFAYLNLFIASMLMLVLANNLLLLFVGWEGVGLCSYLLIGFWYEDKENAKAANKAFIVNRIGDFGLTIGLFLIVVAVAMAGKGIEAQDERYLSFDTILPVLQSSLVHHPALATAIALCLFVGACGKSAQFPLYLWLPDAMAGPTPVSALIHAATMVTSGVVLLNRMHIVFEMSAVASSVVCFVGAFTALFAAIIAFGQTDIKKVLAYSTVSQLGFMFVACGAGAYWVGLFHVTTHAFFKALLFLGSGAVIHAMAHEQDMRKYGKLYKYLPITFITMMIGYLAISGVPGLSGFYSKELILDSAMNSNLAMVKRINAAQVSGWICLLTALLTACYMTRMMMLTFAGKERWMEGSQDAEHATEEHEEHADEHDDDHHELSPSHRPHEVPISMWFPLAVLAVLSAAGGWYLNQGDRFKEFLASATTSTGFGNVIVADETEEQLGHMIGQIAMFGAFAGIIIGVLVYWRGLPKNGPLFNRVFGKTMAWSANQFGYDQAMVSAAVDGGNELATLTDEYVDRGLFGGIGEGIGKVSEGISAGVKRVQSGLVRVYALSMLIGVVGLVAYAVYLMQGGIK